MVDEVVKEDDGGHVVWGKAFHQEEPGLVDGRVSYVPTVSAGEGVKCGAGAEVVDAITTGLVAKGAGPAGLLETAWCVERVAD